MGLNSIFMTNSSTIARIIGTFALVLALILPITGAQKAQATSLPPACLNLTFNLYYGQRDALIYTTDTLPGQITQLQQFLATQGYFSYAATGYFGPVTFRAVQQFQLHNGIIGTGYVGPITRAKIQALTCGVQNDTLSITSMTPVAGPIGTIVTLIGHGFTPMTIVKFGGGAITNTNISYINATRLQFVIPDYMGQYCAPLMACPAIAMQVTPGVYSVTAIDQNRTLPIQTESVMTSNTVNFTVTSSVTTTTPTITSLSSYSGPVGTTVTAYGSGFTSDTTLTIDGSVAVTVVPTIQTSTTLSFTIPSTTNYECFVAPCVQQSLNPGVYTISAHNRYGTGNATSFTITGGTSGNISITGLDAPASLHMGTTGTWTIHAACITCAGGTLHYSVDWNDVYVYSGMGTSSASTVQTDATFTHVYTRTGTYHPVFTVSDDAGHSATTSASVVVQ